jgi:hypothetical protein
MNIKKLEKAKSIFEEQKAVKKTLEDLETLQVNNKQNRGLAIVSAFGNSIGGTVVYINKSMADRFLGELTDFYSAKKEELAKKFEEL